MPKIVIVGAGFAGSILAKQLLSSTNAQVTILEKCSNSGDSETGTGLNLNPNGLESLRSLDPGLESRLRLRGLPRNRMKAETMEGEVLYNESIYGSDEKDLAFAPGLRVRWQDAYNVVRSGLPIRYSQSVVGVSIDAGKQDGAASIRVENTSTGDFYNIDDIDLLIGTDGRYSKIREAVAGTPKTFFIGVSNFRVIVPDTTDGLFDDLELIYNVNVCDQDSLFGVRTLPRIGVMKTPGTSEHPHMLYLFGNFGIDDQIPDEAKTKEGLLKLYRPSGNRSSRKGEYLLNILSQYSNDLHWARMQYTQPLFGNAQGNILLLGDSAHATVPTLGQGATLAIEDACVAAEILIPSIQDRRIGKDTLHRIGEIRIPRRLYVEEVSLESSQHLMLNDDSPEIRILQEKIAWSDTTSAFRNRMERVWKGGPMIGDSVTDHLNGSI